MTGPHTAEALGAVGRPQNLQQGPAVTARDSGVLSADLMWALPRVGSGLPLLLCRGLIPLPRVSSPIGTVSHLRSLGTTAPPPGLYFKNLVKASPALC